MGGSCFDKAFNILLGYGVSFSPPPFRPLHLPLRICRWGPSLKIKRS